MTDFFKMDRAGVTGLICVGVGFLNLIFYSNNNILLFSLMLILTILTFFFIYKDRDNAEIKKYRTVLGMITIGAVLILLFLLFRFNLLG